MHQTDRVKPQFGLLQGIPDEPRCLKEHHKMTTIKSRGYAYTELNSTEKYIWDHRELYTLEGDEGETTHSEEYMQ